LPESGKGAKYGVDLKSGPAVTGQPERETQVSRPVIGAVMCVVALLLELVLFLKHRFWGGYLPDARLALGLFGALLVNIYLIRSRRKTAR
jgi:hypothetical protein